MNTEKQERDAAALITAADYLPGVTRAVSINLLMQKGPETCLLYLLGVVDSIAAIGHPESRRIQRLRSNLKSILRDGVDLRSIVS